VLVFRISIFLYCFLVTLPPQQSKKLPPCTVDHYPNREPPLPLTMRLSWKFQGNENGEQYNAQILTAKVSITILNQPFCPHYHCRAHGSHHHFRAHGSHHHRRWRRRRRLPRPPPPFACTVPPRTTPKSCLHRASRVPLKAPHVRY